MKPDFIITYTGQHVKVWEPDAAVIRIRDIAHALANQCRFNGHSSMFYSVAEHSIKVSQRVEPQHALAGLLHDAAEAYLGDLVTPLKAEMPAFADLEAEWMEAIDLRYSLSIWPDVYPSTYPAAVKLADDDMLAWELHHLLNYGPRPETANPKIQCLRPHEAEQEFLRRFMDLV